MKTKKLFYENPYLKTTLATVTGTGSDGERSYVLLDETIFFPEGGGQNCDLGTINNMNVVDVQEDPDYIFHYIEGDASSFSAGDQVTLSLDWDRRFDNMQRHLGEHILSGSFYRLFKAANKGFHMGSDFITIDLLPEDADHGEITWEMAKAAELDANKVLWADVPVTTTFFATREAASKMPLRKPLAFDEDITIITVGPDWLPDDSSAADAARKEPDPALNFREGGFDTANGDFIYPSCAADCCACCGTHPTSSGQVGMIKIYKIESNRGMYRLYFEAGERAYRHYQARFDVLTQVENSLSAGFADLMTKYDAQREKNTAVRNELYHLKKWIIAKETEEIRSSMQPFMIREYSELSVEDLMDIGRGLEGSIQGVLFLVHVPSNTIALISDDHDCGKLVKENVGIYNGKGGGNKKTARAIFAKAEYISLFADLIEKHLR